MMHYRHFQYEVAIGINGCIWIKGCNVTETIVVRNAILNSEVLNDIQIDSMVDKLSSIASKN
jgi:exosome complex RNA-binding protein Rrp4